MTSNISQSVQRDLDALRHQYEATLGARVAEIVRVCEAAMCASDRLAASRDVARMAHTLAGTSSVLGLTGVGRAAASLEEALDRVADGGTPAAVDSALEQLVSASTEAAGRV